MFKVVSKYKPSGSQPEAIKQLVDGIKNEKNQQVLLGVTGSGKTFTVANVVEKLQLPTLVIAHNKTLAAQLTQEFREYFPHSAVGYFVSYYDYYQPEAYLPNTDTYIEKEATINEEIERLRNAATEAILNRNDVIIVSSVSCIYGLGSPEYYKNAIREFSVGQKISRMEVMQNLVDLLFSRNDIELAKGTFRSVGMGIEIVPASEQKIIKLNFKDEAIVEIVILDSVNRDVIDRYDRIQIFPAKHYLAPENIVKKALSEIERDLEKRLAEFRKEGKIL